ncbi:MAG: hypothetical protein WCT35_08575 [Sideroxydans sp.]|jgi:hypothetical protein
MADSTKDITYSRKIWDFIYGGYSDKDAPALRIDFEGDMHTWEEVKNMAEANGLNPEELLRYALYLCIERGENKAAARARFMAYREWYRTRPLRVSDNKGIRWVPADQLIQGLT